MKLRYVIMKWTDSNKKIRKVSEEVNKYQWITNSRKLHWGLGSWTSLDKICLDSKSLKRMILVVGIWIRIRAIKVRITRNLGIRTSSDKICSDSKSFGYRDPSVIGFIYIRYLIFLFLKTNKEIHNIKCSF